MTNLITQVTINVGQRKCGYDEKYLDPLLFISIRLADVNINI
jgi:hypothetical protein